MKLQLVVVMLMVGSCFAGLHLEWSQYKRMHGKRFTDRTEDMKRFSIWQSNMDFINKHNAEASNGVHSYFLKMNQFGDLTNQEFNAMYNGFNISLKQANSANIIEFNPKVQVPDSIDWRTKGYVTPVKNQEQCGSCWAFSATGSLEGQNFQKTGKLVSLSEQNLVDCSQKQGNQGCNGGLMDQAFTYIKENNGIDTEDSYSYKAKDQKCSFNPSTVGATDTGFVDIKSKDEDALKQAVGTVGPVSVAIDASHMSFQFYSHGVYHELLCSETRLDHGVLAVGYGNEDGKDYWLVKNSWGATWGQKGYIFMSRNKKNNCGIATSASYPTV